MSSTPTRPAEPGAADPGPPAPGATTPEALELRPFFPVLDSLRALGALAVLTTHVAFQTGDYVRHGIVGALLARLDLGVALFFVLSGFLLARPYLARAAAGRPAPATGHYYLKRFVRIVPVYVVAVVAALLVVPGNDPGDLSQWLVTLTMTDTFVSGELPDGLTQMWSLSVEVTFYLVLPWLMLLATGSPGRLRPRRLLVLLGAGLTLSIWWNSGLGTAVDGFTSGAPPLWLPAHLGWFLVGIGLALAHVLHQVRPSAPGVAPLAALGAMPGVCWAAAGGLLLVVATPLGGPTLLLVATPSQSVFKHLAYAAIAGLVVLSGVFASRSGRFARVLSRPGPRHLGHISYSTFCIHLVVLDVVRRMLDHELFSGRGLLVWVLTTALSLAASEVLYRVVERPALRLKTVRPSRMLRGDTGAGGSSSATQGTSTR